MNLNNKLFALNPSFIAIEKLGNGSYGEVFKVHDKASNKYFAVKVIQKKYDTEGIPSDALREISILKKMNHPNVIRLNQVLTGNKNIELCLDYCDFDLRKFKEKYQKEASIYNEQTILHIMYQVLKGMDYLHSKMVMHRDLKPQNILINYSTTSATTTSSQLLQVRIADFGLSRRFTATNTSFTKGVATLWYRAPELLLGNTNYSIGIDMWSIGCIFVELYLNGPLFQGESDIDQLNQISKVFGTSDYAKLIGLNPTNVNYPQFKKTQSVGMLSAMNDQSLIKPSQSCLNLIGLILQIDPSQRITCKDALKHVRLLLVLIV